MSGLTRPPAAALPAEVTATPPVTEPTRGEPPVSKPYTEARALLDDLAGRGITVELAPGGALHVRPKSRVSAEDRERLVSLKPEIVAALKADVEVIAGPKKKPKQVHLTPPDPTDRPRHRGARPPDLGRPFSRSGLEILRRRQLLMIEARDRRQPSFADRLADARARLGRE